MLFQNQKNSKERILKTFSKLDRNITSLIAFSFIDTKEKRGDTNHNVIVNDDCSIHNDVYNTFSEYSIKMVKFSEKENYVEELAA